MAAQAEVGTIEILATDTVSTTKEVNLDAAFEPDFVIFFWGGENGTPPQLSEKNAIAGIGVAISTTGRWAVGSSSEHDATPNTSHGWIRRDDACIATATTEGAVDGLADLNSMDPDGFTLIIDDQFSADLQVSYLAVKDPDYTNLEVGDFFMGQVTDPLEINLTGNFQPNFVLIAATNSTALPGVGLDFQIGIGATIGTGTGQSGVLCTGGRDNHAVPSTGISGYCLDDEFGSFNYRGTNDSVAVLQSFDSDGFTIDFTTLPNTNRQVMYLAIKGGSFDMGSFTTRNDGEEQTESLAFPPAAVLFFSAFRVENASGTEHNDATSSIGAASSTTKRVVHSYMLERSTSPQDVEVAFRNDAVYASLTTGAAIDGLLDVTEFPFGNGFKWKMDDPDSSAKFLWYIAFGPPPAAAGTPGYVSRLSRFCYPMRE